MSLRNSVHAAGDVALVSGETYVCPRSRTEDSRTAEKRPKTSPVPLPPCAPRRAEEAEATAAPVAQPKTCTTCGKVQEHGGKTRTNNWKTQMMMRKHKIRLPNRTSRGQTACGLYIATAHPTCNGPSTNLGMTHILHPLSFYSTSKLSPAAR